LVVTAKKKNTVLPVKYVRGKKKGQRLAVKWELHVTNISPRIVEAQQKQNAKGGKI